ncbi:MAG: ParB/RepB/Spo0J family partition protein [Clostridia bacterium]
MGRKIGRGISELLDNVEDVRIPNEDDNILNVNISKIFPNPNQPRKTFKEDALKELSDSIKEHGIIQPLIVRKDDNKYIIIAGERRYRAAVMASLKQVPVIVRDVDEKQTKEISLIENLQREDLNAIEEGEAMRELMISYHLTQEEIATRLGKARPSIANTLRLLNLTKDVQQLVRNGLISAGHARSLVAISNPVQQIEMGVRAVNEGWSVRELEKRVKYYLKPELAPKKLSKEKKDKLTLEMREFVDDLTKVFETKIRLIGNESKGRISIDYYSKDDLQRIYEVIQSVKQK